VADGRQLLLTLHRVVSTLHTGYAEFVTETAKTIPSITCRRCEGVNRTATPATHREFYNHHDGQRHQDLCRACAKQVVAEHSHLSGVEIVAFSTLARDLGIANAKQASAFCRAETAHDDIIYSMGWSEEQAARHLDKILDNAYARTDKAWIRAEGLAQIDTSENYPVNPYTGKGVDVWKR
jgi:hypothetical protein